MIEVLQSIAEALEAIVVILSIIACIAISFVLLYILRDRFPKL